MARTSLGRSATRFIQLGSTLSSQHHAELRWLANGWTVVDLQSTNGTRVNGRRVKVDAPQPLLPGDRLTFGDSASEWILEGDGPPAMLAQRLGDGHLVVAVDDTLVLPDEQNPLATVYQDHEEGWWVDRPGVTEAVENEALIEAGGLWRVHLPVPTGTELAPRTGLRLAEVTLHLRPNRAYDHVEAWLEHADGELALGSDKHWPVALVLADDRLSDAGPEHDRGWLYTSSVARETGIGERSLDTYFSRIRKGLRAAGVEDATRAVEARPGQRRIGEMAVRIHRPE